LRSRLIQGAALCPNIIYIIGADGDFMQWEAFVRADDTAAIETAKQLIVYGVYGRDVELWQRDRKITKLIGIGPPAKSWGFSSLRVKP
jgi:hypothetical protein